MTDTRRRDREKIISLRVSYEEYSQIAAQAQTASLTISAYIRRCALHRKIIADVDMKMISELRRLGGLLKHVHTSSGGAYSRDTAAALAAIQAYIERMTREQERRSS